MLRAGMNFLISHFLLQIFTVFCLSVAAALPTQIQGLDYKTGLKHTVDIGTHKGLVVVFLSAKCPCSNSHIQELKALAVKYSNFRFVAVHSNSDEPKEMGVNYFKSAQLPFSVIEDREVKIANEFAALKTPHSFILNSKGETLYSGGVSSSSDFARADKKFLRDALEDIEGGKPVRVSYGRTLGCSIVRP